MKHFQNYRRANELKHSKFSAVLGDPTVDQVEAEDRSLANDISSTEKMISRLFAKLPEPSTEVEDKNIKEDVRRKKSKVSENNERQKRNKEKYKLLSMIHDHLKYIESLDEDLSSLVDGTPLHTATKTVRTDEKLVSKRESEHTVGKHRRVQKNMLKTST